MPGNHDAAGRPSPLTKTIRCFSDDKGGLMAGKKVCEIGADGLLGILRNSEEARSDMVSDAMLNREALVI